ncbi:MAG TPA: hypothetical protein VIQ77_04405 [Mucilaginibacter sp.]
MSQIIKYILCCVLLMILTGLSSFAQTPLDNPFAVFHGAKPKGKVDSVLIYRYPHEAPDIYLYVYNRKGQLVKCNWYRYFVNPDFGTTHRDTLKKIFTYNSAGKLVSSTFDSSKSKKTVYYYKFTKYGYCIRTTAADSTKVFEMRFNKLGQMIQRGTYLRGSLDRQGYGNYDYQYDENGNLIRQTEYFDHGWSIITAYRHDSNRNEISSSRTGSGYPRKTTLKYSNYDKNHNWTQQAIDFVNNKDVDDSIHHQDTIRRRITYYK